MDIQEVREILACCSYSATESAVILDLAVALRACPHTDGRRALPYFMQAVETGALRREEAHGMFEHAPQILHSLRDMTGWSMARVKQAIDHAEVNVTVLCIAIGRTVWKTR